MIKKNKNINSRLPSPQHHIITWIKFFKQGIAPLDPQNVGHQLGEYGVGDGEGDGREGKEIDNDDKAESENDGDVGRGGDDESGEMQTRRRSGAESFEAIQDFEQRAAEDTWNLSSPSSSASASDKK